MSESREKMQWMSVQQVAEELEVSGATVRSMIERGELPATKIGKKPLIKINARRFDEWLRQNA